MSTYYWPRYRVRRRTHNPDVLAAHPDMMTYLARVQRMRPSYMAWRLPTLATERYSRERRNC